MRAAQSLVVALLALVALLPAGLAWDQKCITEPVGFGRATVGAGAKAKTVQPNTIKELADYLNSADPLIVDLTKTFDYTGTEGSVTVQGCIYENCKGSTSFQYSLDNSSACQGRTGAQVSYDRAGTQGLLVKSQKTILSSNGKGGLKGKGLYLYQAKDVIIRDISISDINPQVIFAADAIVLDGVTNVWVHGVTVARIGRQFLSTAHANKGVTISSCLFDGETKFSRFCDGTHNWVWITYGTDETITFINNRIVKASGRLPHGGGNGAVKSFIHLIGNLFESGSHYGIEAREGSDILVEGNSWKNYGDKVLEGSNKEGKVAVINSVDTKPCSQALGGNCIANLYDQKTAVPSRLDQTVLKAFQDLDSEAIKGARSAALLCKLA